MRPRLALPLEAALTIAALLIPGTASASAARPPDRPPNIVLLFVDNVGYGDLGCHGNDEVITPRIDRLVGEGVRCTDFYTASPSCTPSRAALLTGRYPPRNGLQHQLSPAENIGLGLSADERLLPAYIGPAGYATACFGKWNIGFAPGTRPTDRGFDEFFGHASGNMDYYTHVYGGRLDLYRGTEPAAASGYSTDLFAEAACDFIRRHADRPFFCYVPFNAAHFPNPGNKAPGQPSIWQAPPEALARYGLLPDEPDPKARYRAVLTALDDGIGRILDQIDASGLRNDTIVIFLSDNGAFMLPDRGLEVASNAPLREGGVTLYEGGIRVPCSVRWPGRIEPGSTCAEPLISLDLFALALSVAGVDPPSDRTIDGRDPTAALTGQGPSAHDALVFTWRGSSAIRKGRFKLHRPEDSAPWALYDLDADLGESRDLAGERPEIVAELAGEFDRWAAEVTGP